LIGGFASESPVNLERGERISPKKESRTGHDFMPSSPPPPLDSLKNEWFSLHLEFTETEKQNLSELDFDNMWIKILQSKNNMGEIKYPNLTALVNTVRSLPNSNADSERIFSFLTDIKTKKRNNLPSASVNAICVIKSALRTRGESYKSMEIDENDLSLISSDIVYKIPIKKKSSLTLYSAADDANDKTVSFDT
jgi:hypothetical protein